MERFMRKKKGRSKCSGAGKKSSQGGKHKPAHRQADKPGQIMKTGELRLHRDGYGFVMTGRAGEEDVFIPARAMGDALNRDTVEVKAFEDGRGRWEGRIAKVLERGMKTLIGRFERYGDGFRVVADDLRVRHTILINKADSNGAHHNDNVEIDILNYPKSGEKMTGRVIKILGERGEEDTEREAVIVKHQLRRGFSHAVLNEAASCRMDSNFDGTGRRDLRNIPFVTIDGETARDFDDAVAAEKIDGGVIRLMVSIADVSHFVRLGTKTDDEAYARATSVYFPNECIPMLPEALSNDLCSLKPSEDRLTMTAQMDILPSGEVVNSTFYTSVINSRERMTYTSVKRMLVEKDESVRERYKNVLPLFDVLAECFERLRAKRIARGSIDFDLPEPLIVIDMQGDVSSIIKAERHIGHMMIEEFMIAANEAVATFLTKTLGLCVYRVHDTPPPDKIFELKKLLHNLGEKISGGKDVTPGELAKIVKDFEGRPESRLVNHMLLRSMSQAVYSAENKGHFGLASKCYCHFTSPIRRYPDLIVHRLMKSAIESGRKTSGQMKGKARDAEVSRLEEMAVHASRRERVAMEAEREMAKLYAAMFMADHVGEKFKGIVSHVTKFGFFVELIDFFVEGVVLFESIEGDKYTISEDGMSARGKKRGRVFKVGDQIEIEVAEVDVAVREINFVMV